MAERSRPASRVSALPAELHEFIVPEYTRRMQFDFTDMTTSAIVRRWAEIDPHIIYVENPHPRLVRDPNRARPQDLHATIQEAFRRVQEAGYGTKVDLGGVDAIRPVTFAFEAVLRTPENDAHMRRMVDEFAAVARQGLDVYQETRIDLLEQMVAIALERGIETATPQHLVTLSFHDTMNHTMGPDGAINVERALSDRLPEIVALSNRGDTQGNQVDGRPVTMDPVRLRALADAHRIGFAITNQQDIALNTPYLGSEEIISAGKRFDELRPQTESAHVTVDAVQAEFRREYLLGDEATAQLMAPGTTWPRIDPMHTDRVAQECQRSWDIYRNPDPAA